MKWEFAIFIKDKDGNRAKKGDIIACKPAPHEWGEKEKKQFLIITMDGLNEEEAHALCKMDWERPDGTPENPDDLGELLNKRRHKIDLDKLGITIDEGKLLDESLDYQPVKDSKKEFKIDEAGDIDLIYDKKDKKTKKVKNG